MAVWRRRLVLHLSGEGRGAMQCRSSRKMVDMTPYLWLRSFHTGLSTPLGTTSLRLNFGGEQGQGMNTAAVDALPAFDSWFGRLRGTVISRVKKNCDIKKENNTDWGTQTLQCLLRVLYGGLHNGTFERNFAGTKSREGRSFPPARGAREFKFISGSHSLGSKIQDNKKSPKKDCSMFISGRYACPLYISMYRVYVPYHGTPYVLLYTR